MSSPITIARSESSQSRLYVPVHKRTGSSPSSSRSPSPSLLPEASSSWRTHTPSKSPSAAFRNKHRKTPSNASYHSIEHTHIPQQSIIPPHITLPNTYSITDLLALSSSAAPLLPEKVESLTGLFAFTAPSETGDKSVAARRRRTGRKGKKQQQQPIETVAVETRRARHGHGTWGWQPHAAAEALQSHGHDLEASWRHGPVVLVS